MLKRILRSLRQKPKPVRDNAAMLIAGVFTCMVFFLWAYHAPTKFSAAERQGGQTESASGFTDLFGQIGSQFGAITEAVKSEEEKGEVVEPGLEEEKEAVFEPSTNSSSAATTTVPTMGEEETATTSEQASSTQVFHQEITPSEARVVKIMTVNSSSTGSTTTAKNL